MKSSYFCQAEDGIRDYDVTGVQTCALPIYAVTAWSFFGTNMLGIGLHSYGFMDKAFAWLMVFVFVQIVMLTGGLMIGTLGQAGKPVVQKSGQAAIGLPPVAQLVIEALVIVASFAITIFYLLKALGIWL